MLTARPAYIIAFALALIPSLTAAVFSPSEVIAAADGIQNCTAGSICTVGEFLYDDFSTPINDAICTITSSYPDGTELFSMSAMDGPTKADGWYSKTFTTPEAVGLYKAEVTCILLGDRLSAEKNFQVDSPVATTDTRAIASTIWSYSGRTVASIGNFISGFLKNVTKTSLEESIPLAKDTKPLEEKEIDKPIIENALNSVMPILGDKLSGTRSQANQIYVNNQFLTSQAALLVSTWNSTGGKEILNDVISLSNLVGTSADLVDSDTMFGSINWIGANWNWEESTSVSNKLVVMDKIFTDLKEGLVNYEKTPVLLGQAKQLVRHSLDLEKIVGMANDLTTKKTLFAKIKTTQDLASNFDEKGSRVDKLLSDFVKSDNFPEIASQVSELQNQVIALNKVPAAGSALVKINLGDSNSVINILLGLRGIIDSNKMLLSLGADKTLSNTWLEVGSIIFKTLVNNPSSLISQDVDIKYYLPVELKKEDVIKTDLGLTIAHDVQKDQLYIEGKISLAPGQTKIFSVETRDIWTFSPEAIGSLRKQVDSLFSSLQKTQYFTYAVSLKSDVNANLDRVVSLLGRAVIPDDKIKSYRESVILKNSVDNELVAMKSLVDRAGSIGGFLGFFDINQTFIIWGVAIAIAGLAFMTIYKTARVNPLGFATVALVSGILSASASAFIVNNIAITKGYEQKTSILGTDVSASQDSAGQGGQDIVKIVVPYGVKVGIYKDATGLVLLDSLTISSDAVRLSQNNNYIEVLLDDFLGEKNLNGVWVNKSFVKEGKDLSDISSIENGSLVLIGETSTGWLKVGDTATTGSKQTGRINPGEKYLLASEIEGWYQIVLKNGTLGWIPAQYASVDGNVQ